MKTFGLTGGIGTGKSTVASLLTSRHGVPVIDADVVAREVVGPGTEGLAAIVEAFGPEVLDAQGALDRQAMRTRVMEDPEARATLQAITHPRIFVGIRDQLAQLEEEGAAVAVVEAALMVETGSWRLYDGLIVVSARPHTQIARVVARDGGTEDDARRILAVQLPIADKEAVATWVIDNDGDLEDLTQRVDAVAAQLGR